MFKSDRAFLIFYSIAVALCTLCVVAFVVIGSLRARPSEKNLRDAHHEFDRAFVEWTNRVNEKAEHVSLASPDFWDEPREWWFEMEVGEKFRRFEGELNDDE